MVNPNHNPALQQDGSGFYTLLAVWGFFCVKFACSFHAFMGFPWGAPVVSHAQSKDMHIRSNSNPKVPIGISGCSSLS